MEKMLGVFDDINDAIDTAYDAQIKLMEFSTDDRQKFIDEIKKEALKVVNEETVKEFEETGYGRLDQKLIKNYGSIADNPGTEDLANHAEIMVSSKGVTYELRAPYGLVGALTPVTNGLVTVTCNAMTMLAAGNTIVFNAHPAAKEAAAKSVDLINRAVVAAGGPVNTATMVRIPTMESLDVIMGSPKVKLLIGTGGEAMVDKLMTANKKVIAAGPGNPPAIVDETADVKAAAKALCEFVPFENNMLCITEKEAFVVESVYDEFIQTMKESGARILTKAEGDKVAAAMISPNASGKLMPNKRYVGKNANVILKAAGIDVDESIDLKLAVIEAGPDHPYVMCEQLMPIFPVVKCRDFEEAMKFAVKAEGGCRHSAAIWSNDITRVTEFGKRIGTSCYAQNGPTVAATGVGGTGYGSSTIATHTGEGFTTPSTFTRVRRFAMGNGGGYVI
jgi:propionaldehyde dehydrogenase